MDIIVSVIGFILVLFFILKSRIFQIAGVSRHLIFALFILKIAGATILYQHYDNLNDRRFTDIFKHYDDGITIKNGFLDHPEVGLKLLTKHKSDDEIFIEITDKCRYWNSGKEVDNFQGNRFMIRLNAVLSLFTFNNYFLHLLFFTLLSYCGMFLLVKCIPNTKIQFPILVALSFAPTILFWSSGILKESLAVFFLGVFCSLSFNAKNILSFVRYFFLLISAYVLFIVKPYLLFAIFLGVVVYQLNKLLNISWLKISIFSLLVSLILFGVFMQFENYNPINKINEKRVEFEELAIAFDAGSTYEIPIINEPIELVYKAPQAVLNVLFRPHALEATNRSYLPFAAESILLLFMTFLLVFFYKKPDNALLKLIVPGIIFILIVCVIIGLTIPILGANVRYRSPAIMVYIIVLFSLLDLEKLKSSLALKKSK